MQGVIIGGPLVSNFVSFGLYMLFIDYSILVTQTLNGSCLLVMILFSVLFCSCSQLNSCWRAIILCNSRLVLVVRRESMLGLVWILSELLLLCASFRCVYRSTIEVESSSMWEIILGESLCAVWLVAVSMFWHDMSQRHIVWCMVWYVEISGCLWRMHIMVGIESWWYSITRGIKSRHGTRWSVDF